MRLVILNVFAADYHGYALAQAVPREYGRDAVGVFCGYHAYRESKPAQPAQDRRRFGVKMRRILHNLIRLLGEQRQEFHPARPDALAMQRDQRFGKIQAYRLDDFLRRGYGQIHALKRVLNAGGYANGRIG